MGTDKVPLGQTSEAKSAFANTRPKRNVSPELNSMPLAEVRVRSDDVVSAPARITRTALLESA
jgi:hypothetical protein